MNVIENKISLKVVDEVVTLTTSIETIKLIEVSPVILEVNNVKNIVRSLQCGEIIGSGKVVYLSENKIYIASNNNPDCKGKIIGMTQQAGILDEFIPVVTFGELNGLSLMENKIYYLGINGSLTDTIPISGFYQPIGIGIETDKININIGNYIIRG